MAIFGTKRSALDPRDQADLDRLAAIVDRHVADYRAVGAALREIRDRKLYRTTHETFEDFTRERWQMDRTHAYRLIDAATVAHNLSPTGDAPKTERQARPLTQLNEGDQVKAWTHAAELAGTHPITTAHIEQAAAAVRPRRKKKRHPKPIRIRVPAGIVVIHPGKQFTAALDALIQAQQKLTARAEAA